MRQLAARQVRSGAVTRTDLATTVYPLSVTRVGFADSPFTVPSTLQLVEVDTTFGGVEVLLEASAAIQGRVLIVKDAGGNASVSKPLTLTPDGADTIDGGAALVLTTPFDVRRLVATPSGWSLI